MNCVVKMNYDRSNLISDVKMPGSNHHRSNLEMPGSNLVISGSDHHRSDRYCRNFRSNRHLFFCKLASTNNN